ncbi:MAG: hydrocarbon binding protein [Actinomycetia bacterium]|nr:hydrocarbon binding protein [Actinomycetes bacterium]
MLYVPQHFFANNHKAVEERLGAGAHAELLFKPGYESARTWCEYESARHGLSGEDVFRHYMQRLSQRGWAQFSVEQLDSTNGTGRVRVDHSVFVLQHGGGADRPLCYMFSGWLCGSLEWVMADRGEPLEVTAEETACAAQPGHDHCLFDIGPNTRAVRPAGTSGA